MEQMSKEVAHQFFVDFFCGAHHFGGQLKEWGYGWCMPMRNNMATIDYNGLTKLVLMAHDRAIRVEIVPRGMSRALICIWQRDRSTGMSTGHPTIEQAIEKHRLNNWEIV